jgi:5'-3' exonuclease
LVEDGKVIVIRPGNDGEQFYDEEKVVEEFGVRSSDLACYLSFRGDTVDNIPGVPRLPSKIISVLTSKYKEPREVYASVGKEKLTDFQRESLRTSEKQIYINFSIIKLKTDLDVNISNGISDVDKLDSILKKYEIKSIPAESLVRLFGSESSFNMRTMPVPQVISFSLF